MAARWKPHPFAEQELAPLKPLLELIGRKNGHGETRAQRKKICVSCDNCVRFSDQREPKKRAVAWIAAFRLWAS
jgi:hypothetical protein